MDLRLFGGFQLFDDTGSPVEITARKTKALLAWLALHPGKRHQRERLSLLLWEESDEAQARHSLRQALSGLRKALGSHAEALSSDQESLCLNVDQIQVDAQRFDQLLERQTEAAQIEAVALYGGEFLEAFNPRSDNYEEWLLLQRSHYRERAMTAMSALLEHYMASGQLEPGVRLAIQLLSSDPLQEWVHCALMQLYAKLNRPADALRQYRQCRRILFRELNITPEPETDRLFREISEKRQHAPQPATSAPITTSADAHPKTDTPNISETVKPKAATAEAAPELRPISVAHLCLAHYQQQLHELDPEQVHQQIRALSDRIERLASAYGGQLHHQHADNWVVLFGLPVARGNESEKALQFAFKLFTPHPDEAHTATDWGMRIGIASGSVIYDDQGTIAGGVWDQAAQLARSADPQTVLMGDTSYRGLRLAVTATPHDASSWRITAIGETGTTPSGAAPFVGRRRERRQFDSALHACVEDAAGETFLLRGEAGIGKTRLIQEICQRADQLGIASHHALVLDFGMESRSEPIPSLLRQLLALDNAASAMQIEKVVQTRFGDRWNSHLHHAALHALFRLPLEAGDTETGEPLTEINRQSHTRQLLQHLLEWACETQPRLLVVEDIHWADQQTLAWLAELASAVSHCAALLIITSRIEGEPLDPQWRSAMHGAPLTTIDLTPLPAQQAQELATALSGAGSAFIQNCIDRSGGNPFFLEQLLWNGEANADRIPDSVQSLVLNRLDLLSANDRRAAQAASVLGQRFKVDALKQILEQADYRPDELLNQRLVRPEGDAYLFAHALLRDGIYASLLMSQRRALHLLAANWFQQQEPALYARHLDLAEDPRAASAYLTASQQAVRRFDFEQALALASRGQAISREPALTAQLQLQRGDLLIQAGVISEANHAFESAVEMTPDETTRCRALIGLATGLTVQDDLDSALDRLQQAAPLAQHCADVALQTEIHYRRGDILFAQGKADACLQAHQQAEQLARAAQAPLLEIRALAGIADAYYVRGQMRTAKRHFEQCIERARQQKRLPQELGNLSICGLTRFYSGSVADALADEFEAAKLAAEYGNLRAEMTAYLSQTLIYLYTRHIDKAEQAARTGLKLVRQLGASRFYGDTLAGIGEALVLQGDIEGGLDYLEQAYQAALDSVPTHIAGFILGVLARVTPDRERQDRAITEGQRLLDQGCVGHNYLHFYQNLIDVYLNRNDPAGARHYAEALERYTAAEPLAWSDFYIRRGRLLATALESGIHQPLIQEASELLARAEQIGLYFGTPELEALLAP